MNNNMNGLNKNGNEKIKIPKEFEDQVEKESEIILIKENFFEKYTGGSEIFKIMTECNEFGNKLHEKYPKDYSSYSLYHVLIGGTPPPGCKNFDFPGDDSVYEFFQKLKTEHGIEYEK